MKRLLGLGNALVDILMQVEDSFVESLNFKKGSMNHIDLEKAREIISKSVSIKKDRVTGGSVANAIHGLAKLGVSTSYIGKIGEDEFGDFFRNEMIVNGITPHLLKGKQGTGTAICMISKDSERTFATYLGAAIELTPEELEPDNFAGNDFFFLEGYMVQDHNLVKRSLQIAKKSHTKVIIDLSSFNIVEENLSFLKDSIREYVDIVFANEDEAVAFTSECDPLKSARQLSEYCDIAVVKTGATGSIVIDRNKNEYMILPFKAIPVDTTGAGDFYAAGFLYGLINELPLLECGRIGSFLASKVVEVIGANLPDSQWEIIATEIDAMKK